MLTLYFNAQLNGPMTRTSAAAMEDAAKVVGFIADNRRRKRAEMQLAIAKLLGEKEIPRKSTNSSTSASHPTTSSLMQSGLADPASIAADLQPPSAAKLPADNSMDEAGEEKEKKRPFQARTLRKRRR